jgi:hypothetical protein
MTVYPVCVRGGLGQDDGPARACAGRSPQLDLRPSRIGSGPCTYGEVRRPGGSWP